MLSRLRENGFRSRVVEISIRDNELFSFTRQKKIDHATNITISSVFLVIPFNSSLIKVTMWMYYMILTGIYCGEDAPRAIAIV